MGKWSSHHPFFDKFDYMKNIIMTDSNQRGVLTELHYELFCTERKILLSKPIIQDSRYDYVMEYNKKLYKVQCKSSTFKEDKIVFRAHMNNIRQNTTTYYSEEDVDFFYTYYNGISYLIPFQNAGKDGTTLRFTSKTPNNPTIRWAKDYEADKILQNLDKKEEVI